MATFLKIGISFTDNLNQINRVYMIVMGWGHDFYKVVEKRGRKANERVRDGVESLFLNIFFLLLCGRRGNDNTNGWHWPCLEAGKEGDWVIGLWRQFSLGFFLGQRYVKQMRLILRMMYQILIANS